MKRIFLLVSAAMAGGVLYGQSLLFLKGVIPYYVAFRPLMFLNQH